MENGSKYTNLPDIARRVMNSHDVTPSLKFEPKTLLFILLNRIIEAIAVIRDGLIQPIRHLFKHVWVRKPAIFNMKCCIMHL